jgi:dihydrofolate synthase / folylpolyglutamate synthase
MGSYRTTLRFLYGLQLRGIKLGLSNTRALLASVGQPQKVFPSIHIAGTNGKGSTSAFIASILQEAGFKTGLYTSPHLVRFTERIRVNGKEIPEARLVAYAARLRPEIERRRATFFEATTCIALKYFADEQVDVAVIETGLGGRFDATNVLTPLVSVITNISLEHTEILGDTVKAIAREKAGIIKQGIPILTGTDDPEALGVFERTARRLDAPLALSRGHARFVERNGKVSLVSRGLRPLRIQLGLHGPHQAKNAVLAIAALRTDRLKIGEVLLRKVLGGHVLQRGLRRVRENTGLRGRLEEMRLGGKRYIFDVAHNPGGMETLSAALRGARPAAVVFGMLKEKDLHAMLPQAAALGGRLVCVTAGTPRGLKSSVLVRKARKMGIDAVDGGRVATGISMASRIRGKTIVVCGSHYVVGPALEALGIESP